MKKTKKRNKRRNRRVQTLRTDGDTHVAFGDVPIDRAAWAESVDTVAKADRAWLREHPKAEYRRRPIALVEMQMTGYDADCEVVISHGADGSQVRVFFPPSQS